MSDRAEEVRIDRRLVIDATPVFVWEATVTFTTTYNLPDNVIEQAIVRAIGTSSLVRVDSLRRSRLGGEDG